MKKDYIFCIEILFLILNVKITSVKSDDISDNTNWVNQFLILAILPGDWQKETKTRISKKNGVVLSC